MPAPAVQRNLQQILIIPRRKYGVTPLFRDKKFYFTLLILFLWMLLAAFVEYGRGIHEMPPV
jgi:hypothetical protein